jgi:hypothetical protein
MVIKADFNLIMTVLAHNIYNIYIYIACRLPNSNGTNIFAMRKSDEQKNQIFPRRFLNFRVGFYTWKSVTHYHLQSCRLSTCSHADFLPAVMPAYHIIRLNLFSQRREKDSAIYFIWFTGLFFLRLFIYCLLFIIFANHQFSPTPDHLIPPHHGRKWLKLINYHPYIIVIRIP